MDSVILTNRTGKIYLLLLVVMGCLESKLSLSAAAAAGEGSMIRFVTDANDEKWIYVDDSSLLSVNYLETFHFAPNLGQQRQI